MNYKRMCFELRNKLMEIITKEKGIFEYMRCVYREILFTILKKEELTITNEDNYQKVWYLTRLKLTESSKFSNTNKDIFQEVLFIMLDIEHKEKGFVAKRKNKGE